MNDNDLVKCPLCGGCNLDGKGVGEPDSKLPMDDESYADGWTVVDFICLDCGHRWGIGND